MYTSNPKLNRRVSDGDKQKLNRATDRQQYIFRIWVGVVVLVVVYLAGSMLSTVAKSLF